MTAGQLLHWTAVAQTTVWGVPLAALPTLCRTAARACRVTVAGEKGEGDVVNVEVEAQTQAIVDTVERVLQRYLDSGRLPEIAAPL